MPNGDHMAAPYTAVPRPGPYPDKVRGLGGCGSIRSVVRPNRDSLTRAARPLSGVPVSGRHRICMSWLRQPARPPRPSARAFHHSNHTQRHAGHDSALFRGSVAPYGNRANRHSCQPAMALLCGHGSTGRVDCDPQLAAGARHSDRSMNLLPRVSSRRSRRFECTSPRGSVQEHRTQVGTPAPPATFTVTSRHERVTRPVPIYGYKDRSRSPTAG
jgi:hypothetical protein